METVPDPALGAARSLREVFETLAGDPDPDAALAAAGHAGLPADLFTEALVNYADTAPPEVAEHLSPVVLGASSDAGLGLELLSSAPQVTWEDDGEALAEEPTWEDDGPALEELDFGAGGDGLDALDALDTPVDDVPAGEVPTTAAAGDDDLPGDDDLAGEDWADGWAAGADDLPDEDATPDDDLPDA
jgi:hypothetical protein